MAHDGSCHVLRRVEPGSAAHAPGPPGHVAGPSAPAAVGSSSPGGWPGGAQLGAKRAALALVRGGSWQRRSTRGGGVPVHTDGEGRATLQEGEARRPPTRWGLVPILSRPGEASRQGPRLRATEVVHTAISSGLVCFALSGYPRKAGHLVVSITCHHSRLPLASPGQLIKLG
jgi:hypothetical protein